MISAYLFVHFRESKSPDGEQVSVPFIADDLKSGRFIRSEEQFSFPYLFKHGTVLTITTEEYNRINHYFS